MTNETQQTPVADEDIFAPLRDIGTEENHYWDADDIQSALREAFARGISPERFFNTQIQTGPTPTLAAA